MPGGLGRKPETSDGLGNQNDNRIRKKKLPAREKICYNGSRKNPAPRAEVRRPFYGM